LSPRPCSDQNRVCATRSLFAKF